MSAAPGISVILPVHDGATWLADCLESVLAQGFGDFELIAIDDGSTDETAAILHSQAERDSRIRVTRQPHSGLVTALNHGLALARGDFIARIDADDVALPHRFERQLRFLEAHADVAVVGSSIRTIDAQGAPTGTETYPRDARPAMWRGENGLAHPAVMIRRAAFQAVGGYDPRFRHAEDLELWLRMADRFPLANLREPLQRVRRHPGSVSARHRVAQIVAGRTAVIAARLRREGAPDPLAGVDRLTLEGLLAMPMRADERAALRLDIVELVLQAIDQGLAPGAELARLAGAVMPGAPTGRSVDLAAALIGGHWPPFSDSRAAHRMAAVARHLARSGDGAGAGVWLMRAAKTHRFGPFGIAGLAFARAMRR